jgi:hypothetical protein
MTTISKIVKMWVKCGNSLPELVYHLGDGDFEVIEESNVFNDEELQYLCDNHSYPDEKLFAKVFVEEFGTINIPEEIFNCVKEAHEKEYTTEGFCIDCYYENCFDYDFDFAVNKWLHNNNEDNGFLISQLYAQCVLKNI